MCYILKFESLMQSSYIESVSSRSIWWHYLVVTVPDKVEYPDHSLLYITDGYNTDALVKHTTVQAVIQLSN